METHLTFRALLLTMSKIHEALRIVYYTHTHTHTTY